MTGTTSPAREVQVTFDCADPGALAEFWAAALGYVLQPPPPGFDTWDAALDAWGVPPGERTSRSAAVDPAGAGPRLFFQRVPESIPPELRTPSSGPRIPKNPLHLDVRAAPGLQGDERMAALESECERLVALGATRVKRYEPEPPMGGGHIVMADPEGNVFCLD